MFVYCSELVYVAEGLPRGVWNRGAWPCGQELPLRAVG